jgi:hypothetical protein
VSNPALYALRRRRKSKRGKIPVGIWRKTKALPTPEA